MVDIAALKPATALAGLNNTVGDTTLREVSSLFIASLAIPKGKKAALNSQLQQHWEVSFPDTGTCVRASDTKLAGSAVKLVLFGLQMEQCLMIIDSDDVDPAQAFSRLHELLGSDAYITDLSDSFAVLELQGGLMLPAMERLCMLDLAFFDEADVARTVMEHLSVIIERPASDCMRLYSPRSSAGSFLDAVQVSMHNVYDDQ